MGGESMRTPRLITTAALFGFLFAIAAQGQTWYRFRKTFINSTYQNGVAFGSVTATAWAAAATIHPTKCGGKDGELHIGVFDAGIDTGTFGGPPSAPIGSDSDWGLVAELPDANAGAGPSTLDGIKTETVTFTGFVRVWDEGHGTGQVFPSNPHHVLEVHPVWAFQGAGGTSFEDRELIRAMAGYQGYGATKFKPVLKAVHDGEWPLVYQDTDFLYVQLRKADNFYQLPVTVQNVSSISSGHEATVDVYSDRNFQILRYEGLRCLTVTGSDYDNQWEHGTSDFLLGFFSVNLKKCLEQSAGASDEASAVAVPQAVELFVFGHATKSALAACN
jgi:hypothetical protein